MLKLTDMWTTISFVRRPLTAAFLLLLQVFASTQFIAAAAQDSSDPRLSGYNQSQSESQGGEFGYGYPQQQNTLDMLRQRCSGPDASPECDQMGTMGLSSSAGGGAQQIYSDDRASSMLSPQLGRYTYPFPYVYAPQPPTEFQRLVYESVGQQLKIFGVQSLLECSHYVRTP